MARPGILLFVATPEPTLATRRLRLEPWDETRRGDFSRLAGDKRVTEFIGEGRPLQAAEADEVFDRALRHWEEHGFGWWSAVDVEARRWIGFVGVNYVPPGTSGVGDDEVEIGWWLHPSVWGRGLATEGALAVRDHSFGVLTLPALVARMQSPHSASRRVAEAIGMELTRAGRGRYGEELVIYELSRDRWLRTRKMRVAERDPAPPERAS